MQASSARTRPRRSSALSPLPRQTGHRRLPSPWPSSPTRSRLRIRSSHPAGERPVPAVVRRFEEHRLPELVVAAVAGDSDVSLCRGRAWRPPGPARTGTASRPPVTAGVDRVGQARSKPARTSPQALYSSRRGTVSCTQYRIIPPLAVPSARLHDHITQLACRIPEARSPDPGRCWPSGDSGAMSGTAVYTAFRSSLMTSAAVESSSSRIFTYRVVVVRSPWPSRCRTRARSTPWSISHEACVCRTW